MDLATVLGIVLAFVLMTIAILLGGELKLFVDIPSVVLVFGGTTTALFTKFTMGEVFGSFKVFMKSIFIKLEPPEKVIAMVIDLANIARKDGILALEKVKPDDPFLQTAINHCVDGSDPDFLEKILLKEIDYLAARHERGAEFWDAVGEMAPAWGMIGTLIGLVQMLANMSDPAAIGPGMAVAILTTLYGAVIANVIAMPVASKLRAYSKQEMVIRQTIIDGMLGIQKGVNPRALNELLIAALSPKQRSEMD